MSGKDLYRACVTKMLRDPHYICLVYDSTDSDSFRALDTWMDVVKKTNGNKDFPGIIVSTKNDLGSLKQVIFIRDFFRINVTPAKVNGPSGRRSLPHADGIRKGYERLSPRPCPIHHDL